MEVFLRLVEALAFIPVAVTVIIGVVLGVVVMVVRSQRRSNRLRTEETRKA